MEREETQEKADCRSHYHPGIDRGGSGGNHHRREDFYGAGESSPHGLDMEVGETVDKNEEYEIEYAQAPVGDNLMALQLVPMDIEEEGFTYYDAGVQERLEGALEGMKDSRQWTATEPLAILNPYGTASNGLYLYLRRTEKRRSPIRFMWRMTVFRITRLRPWTPAERIIQRFMNSR